MKTKDEINAYSKQYYIEHREHCIADNKRRRIENIDFYKKYDKEYYKKNKVSKQEYYKKYWLKNKDRLLKQMKAYKRGKK